MAALESVLQQLQRNGLLLQQEKSLPNVVTLLTGEVLSGSWWSHPKAHLIFAILQQLQDHPDVLFTKLLGGKVTLVHRRLWPAVLAVGRAKESWQTKSLSPEALRILLKVEQGRKAKAAGKTARELQDRLLVVAREEHTEKGRHEMMLESWEAWSKGKKIKSRRSIKKAKEEIEEAVRAITGIVKQLPWHKS